MKSPVVKRSIVIAGHKTSVSLEDAFWKGLKEIAGGRDMTLSELVAAIQGREPERMHVVLGRGAQPEVFSVQRYLAYFRKIKRDFQAALAAMPITYPEPVEHCDVCDWFPHCNERWHREDHRPVGAGTRWLRPI